MLWLDGLLALPAIGIRIVPNFKEIQVFNNALNDFINYLAKEYSDLEIEVNGIWGYSVTAKKEGSIFLLTQNKIAMRCGYHIEKKARPGKLPRFEMPELKSYSENFDLLVGHFDRLLKSFEILENFQFNRIGIVAEANTSKDLLPPGAEKWIQTLEKSLGGTLTHSKTSLLSKISDSEEHFEQCHHIIDFDDYRPEFGIHLKLDWQRSFKKPTTLKRNNSLKLIESCKKEAFVYFEKFAEGNLGNG